MPTQLVTHEHIVGDTAIPISATLKRNGSAFILTGYTVEFKMINDAGDVIVDWTAASVVSATNGAVQYDFQTADVSTAGIYWAWFRAVSGGEYETWPRGSTKRCDTEPARVFKVIIRDTE